MAQGPPADFIGDGFDVPFIERKPRPAERTSVEPPRDEKPSGTSDQHAGVAGIGASKIAGFDAISPIDIGTTRIADGTTAPTRRRGRPPGSRNRTIDDETEIKTPGDLKVGNIESLLLSIHFAAGKLVHESLELDAGEAKKLADAIRDVQKHYPTVIDPKKVAVANLFLVAGGIYGTRIVAAYNNKKKEAPVQQVTPPNVQAINKPAAKAANGPVNQPRTPADLDLSAPIDYTDGG